MHELLHLFRHRDLHGSIVDRDLYPDALAEGRDPCIGADHDLCCSEVTIGGLDSVASTITHDGSDLSIGEDLATIALRRFSKSWCKKERIRLSFDWTYGSTHHLLRDVWRQLLQLCSAQHP